MKLSDIYIYTKFVLIDTDVNSGWQTSQEETSSPEGWKAKLA